MKYKVQIMRVSSYPYILAPNISPDNRQYIVGFKYPKAPSDEKCLGPKNPLIRPWDQYVILLHF